MKKRFFTLFLAVLILIGAAVPAWAEGGGEIALFDPTETTAQIEATLPEELPEAWREAVLAVAKSQLGYTAYRTDEINYNRYLHWAKSGADANAAFAQFCVHYAGVEAKRFPVYDSAELWAAALAKAGTLLTAEYKPAPGDLVFLDLDPANNPQARGEDGEPLVDEAGKPVLIPTADTVGVVSSVGSVLWVIIGGSRVEELQITQSVIGFAAIPEKPLKEDEAAEETDAEREAPKPTEEKQPEAEEAPAKVESYTIVSSGAGDPWILDNHILAPKDYVFFKLPDTFAPDQTCLLNDQPLYWDADEGIFYTMIPKGSDIVVTVQTGARTVLSYSPDVNGDGVLNIADANAIYQMVQNGGDYYTVDQIGVEARLRVDYKNIVDFDTIINLINGV